MSGPRHRFTERQVLLWILAACMLAFIVMFLVMILRQRVAPPQSAKRPVVHYVPAQQSSPQWLFAEMMDPSLLALPNLHGYSQSLWRRGVPAQHRSFAAAVTPIYLQAEPAAELPELLPQPDLATAVRWQSDKALADPLDWQPAPLTETSAAATQSVARLEGELAERPLIAQPSWPTIDSPSPLRPTQLRLGVSGDGVVRYVSLQRSSGSEAADSQALALARQLQFAPRVAAQNQQISWGALRVVWLAQPPPAAVPPPN